MSMVIWNRADKFILTGPKKCSRTLLDPLHIDAIRVQIDNVSDIYQEVYQILSRYGVQRNYE